MTNSDYEKICVANSGYQFGDSMKLVEKVRAEAERLNVDVVEIVRDSVSEILLGNSTKGSAYIDVGEIYKKSSNNIPAMNNDLLKVVRDWLSNEGFSVQYQRIPSLAVQRGDHSGYGLSVIW